MRFAIQFEIPVDVGNALEKDPKAAELIAGLFETMKPEAAYFCSTRRYGIIFVNADSQDELSKIVFPIWHNFKTYPQVDPVRNIEEFPEALKQLGELTKNI